MSPEEAMERINVVMAHAWMVRNFLKHADEVQEDEELLEVHRMIFDFIRAAEPSYQRKDAKEYLHRVRGKLAINRYQGSTRSFPGAPTAPRHLSFRLGRSYRRDWRSSFYKAF